MALLQLFTALLEETFGKILCRGEILFYERWAFQAVTFVLEYCSFGNSVQGVLF